MPRGKNFLILSLFLLGTLSGCATYEDFLTENNGDTQHKRTSEPDDKLTREQRESIMSGQRPVLSSKTGNEVSIPVFRW